MNFFKELKRRNVFRMGIAYIVVAWVLLQAIDFTLDIISAPNWVMQVFFLAAVVGLPVVLIISWVFEMTPEGIKRETEIDRTQSVTRDTGHKLDRTIIVFLAFAVVLLLTDRFFLDKEVIEPPAVSNVVETKTTQDTPAKTLRSVAVLPFVNMSSDPEQEYFSDGLSEELLNRLAKNDRLHVAARTSSFQFKGQNQDISDIGRQLNVEHVLEGSVRKAGNRLRITAQLIRVDSGFHLWSDTYEREMDDVFAIQDDISHAIAKALETELGMTATVDNQKPTENLEAYQLYLHARYLLAQRGGDNILEAIDLFRQVTSLDDNFSEAWSGMAFAYSLVPGYTTTLPVKQVSDEGIESANQAIRIKADNAEAYMALGRILATMDLKIHSARENFEKAYKLAPNNVDVVNIYGDFLTTIGDFDKAVRIENRAIELDPLTSVHYSDITFLLLNLNRPVEALKAAQTSSSLAPGSVDRQDALISALIRVGKYDQAAGLINSVEKNLQADPGYVTGWWSMFYFYKNDLEGLREQLNKRQGDDVVNGSFNSPMTTAFYTLWLDGIDAALPILQKSYEERENYLTTPDFFYLPEFVSDHPEWIAFWQQPGLLELVETRREFGPFEQVGMWKEPISP